MQFIRITKAHFKRLFQFIMTNRRFYAKEVGPITNNSRINIRQMICILF